MRSTLRTISKREGNRRARPTYSGPSERNRADASSRTVLYATGFVRVLTCSAGSFEAEGFRSRDGPSAHASSFAWPAKRDGWCSHTCAGRGPGQRHRYRRESRAKNLRRCDCANGSARHPEPLQRLRGGGAAWGFAVCRAPSPRFNFPSRAALDGTSPATESVARDETF